MSFWIWKKKPSSVMLAATPEEIKQVKEKLNQEKETPQKMYKILHGAIFEKDTSWTLSQNQDPPYNLHFMVKSNRVSAWITGDDFFKELAQKINEALPEEDKNASEENS